MRVIPLSLAILTAGRAAAAETYSTATFLSGGWGAFLGEVFRSVDVVGFVLLVILLVNIGMSADLFNHLRLSKLIPEGLLDDVQEEMGNGEYEKALELCSKSDSLIGQVFAAVLSKTDYSFDRMEEAMRSEVKIQGLVWRQWTRQFRVFAFGGFLLGFLGAIVEGMRFVADMTGRPNIALALASSFEVRALLYNLFMSLFIGGVMALLSLAVYTTATSKLEKMLLEAERLGEELLDPFRPLPLTEEE
ncbi:MAG: hypothetical protein LUE17_06205 [Planctomycetaceae bacterium]|nr:hypothetical protein [Planctomycetaceae bacterium]